MFVEHRAQGGKRKTKATGRGRPQGKEATFAPSCLCVFILIIRIKIRKAASKGRGLQAPFLFVPRYK
jgi:hypothetical protein